MYTSYVFVKNQVDKGEISVKNYKTEHMMAEYVTNLIQGTLFCMFRVIIFRKKHTSNVDHLIDALTKERVGSTRDEEIDKEVEKSVSWDEFVKGRKRVKHAHKR